MKTLASLPILVAAVLMPRIVAATSPAGGTPDGAEAAGARHTTQPVVSTFFASSAASSNETFDYQLHAFSRQGFASRDDFEAWMDNLGAQGYLSVIHFGNDIFDPADDTRVFGRGVGGPQARVIDYDIERYRIDPGESTDVWVPEWDRLGATGKILVFLFKEGARYYAVTETTLLDGELQTWSWARIQAGTDAFPSVAEWKRAAKKLAKQGYIPRTVGFSADRSKFYVVGIKNTTPGHTRKVKLRFRRITLTTPDSKWKSHANKQGKKGYELVAVELAARQPMDFLMVFAQEKVDGLRTRIRRCDLEPVLVNDQQRMVDNLNALGADGRREYFVTNVGSFDSPTFFVCDPDDPD